MIHSKIEKQKDSYEVYVTDYQELVYYDLDSSKLIPIRAELISRLLKKPNEVIINHSQDELVLTHLNDPQGIRIVRYSLVENKIKSELTIETKHFLLDGKGLTSAKSANNRLYMIGNLKHGTFGEAPTIIVADCNLV
jgi:hypothetical protein